MKISIQIFLVLTGFVIGTILTGLFLYQFIDTQRNQGQNEGKLNAQIEIFEFLKENVKNNTLNKEIKEIGKYYGFKYFDISVVEINRIQTIQTNGIE